MHCQNSSCPPHARSTSTLADVHGLQARFIAENGRARDWKDTRTALTKASALAPNYATYDLQMPITLATDDNSPLASLALRRFRNEYT